MSLMPCATCRMSLEPFLTWQRIFNIDEVNITFMPTDDVQATYTVVLCTSASGDILMPMMILIFDGTTQLDNPIHLVAGHLIFEACNDSHWSNSLVHEQYLKAVFASLTPCLCEKPECKAYCPIIDR